MHSRAWGCCTQILSLRTLLALPRLRCRPASRCVAHRQAALVHHCTVHACAMRDARGAGAQAGRAGRVLTQERFRCGVPVTLAGCGSTWVHPLWCACHSARTARTVALCTHQAPRQAMRGSSGSFSLREQADRRILDVARSTHTRQPYLHHCLHGAGNDAAAPIRRADSLLDHGASAHEPQSGELEPKSSWAAALCCTAAAARARCDFTALALAHPGSAGRWYGRGCAWLAPGEGSGGVACA